MSGPFDRAAGQGQSPRSPVTPGGASSSTYQVNVNRQKTRKWVEAKVQSYDGDDWGASESEEEPESPPASTQTHQPPTRNYADESAPTTHSGPGNGVSPSMLPSVSEIDAKRASASPQLPNVARMSTFGTDFFSSSGFSDAPLASQSTIDEDAGGSPSHVAPATESTGVPNLEPALPQPVPPPSVDPVKETPATSDLQSKDTSGALHDADDSEASGGTAADDSESRDHLKVADDPRSLPPLRTPSPHEPQNVSALVANPTEPSASATSDRPPVEITPTEPLQPKKPEYSPSDYEPQSLERQPTIDTMTSSPVKESDVLSDEIMRTLTPGGLASPIEQAENKRVHELSTAELSAATSPDSSYYDVAEHPVELPVESTVATEPTPVPATAIPATTNPTPPLRRKFSWEAQYDEEEDEEGAQPSRSAVTDVGVGSTAASVPLPSSAEQTSSPGVASPIIKVVPETGDMSHQVSEASSGQRPVGRSSVVEPPSPLSEPTDRDGGVPGSRSPPAEDANSALSAPTLVSSAPNQEGIPTLLSDISEGGPNIMTFREIMYLSSPAERIAKYGETRATFGKMDTGLDKWIASMQQEYPEHANTTALHSGGVTAPPRSPNGSPAQPSPQPYYQQYLNASAPSPHMGSARSRLAGLPMQAQAAGSAFGHSGNQIGSKGKEFVQSAGKMGKGLFSKGRSKLRGTGDKDDHSPPPPPVPSLPHDQKVHQKSERRKSWALALGDKFRPSSESTRRHVHDDTPQPYQSHQGIGVASVPVNSAYPNRDRDEKFPRSSWLPDIGPQQNQYSGNTSEENNTCTNAISYGPEVEQPLRSDQEPQTSTTADWPLAAPRQRDVAAVAEASHQEDAQTQRTHRRAATMEESRVVAMADPGTTPRRNPSFHGLPPIRRNSSFGLSSFNAIAEAARKVSLDDATDVAADRGLSGGAHRIDGPVDSPAQTVDIPAHVADDGPTRPHGIATGQSLSIDNNATLVGSMGQQPRSSLQKDPYPHHDMRPDEQFEDNVSLDDEPVQTQSAQHLTIQTHPAQIVETQNIHTQPPPTSPAVPPSGWHLEESHLAEPLQAARRRAGTGGSPQQDGFEYDKETGLTTPYPPSAPGFRPDPESAPYPPRSRVSAMPPSSSQRYPELFKPAEQQQPSQPHPQAHRLTQAVPSYGGSSVRSSIDSLASAKAIEAGYSPPPPEEQHDDRGRRTSSAIFRGFGDRIRAASRERLGSSAGQRSSQPVDAVGDDEEGQGRKRRTSFLPQFRSRNEIEPGSLQAQSQGVTPQTFASEQNGSSFDIAGGMVAPPQPSFIQGSRPSTSSTLNGGGSTTSGSMGPPKKRFSGLADKATGWAGKLHRTKGEDGSHKPDPDHSTTSSGNAYSSAIVSRASLVQSSMEQDSNVGYPDPMDMAPPPPLDSGTQERRSRRGSFTGRITNFVRERSSSRSRRGDEEAQMTEAPRRTSYNSAPPTTYPDHVPAQTSLPVASGETLRGSSIDLPRRPRHISGQFSQPPRPSPLAQESSAFQDREDQEPDRFYTPQSDAGAWQQPHQPQQRPADGHEDPEPDSEKRAGDDRERSQWTLGGVSPPAPQPSMHSRTTSAATAVTAVTAQENPQTRVSSGPPPRQTPSPQYSSEPFSKGRPEETYSGHHRPSFPSSAPATEPQRNPLRPPPMNMYGGYHQTPQGYSSPIPQGRTSIQGYPSPRRFASGAPQAQPPPMRIPHAPLRQPSPEEFPPHSSQSPQTAAQEPSRFKGWRNRISSQLAQVTPQGFQGKSDKSSSTEALDKESRKSRLSAQWIQSGTQSTQQDKRPQKVSRISGGEKLFGAFKRSSKQQDTALSAPPSEGNPPPGWVAQPPQWGPQHAPSLPALSQRTPAGQWQTAQPPRPYAYGEPQVSVPGHHSMYGQQAWHHQQQSYGHHQYPDFQHQQPGFQQPQNYPQPEPEPQYVQVPIPKGYDLVHGEGMTAPTNYNVGRGMPPMGQGMHVPQQPPMQHQPHYRRPPGYNTPKVAQTLPAQPLSDQDPSRKVPPATPVATIHNQHPEQAMCYPREDTYDEGSAPPFPGFVSPGPGPPREGRGQPQSQSVTRNASTVSVAGTSVESGVLGRGPDPIASPRLGKPDQVLRPQPSAMSIDRYRESQSASQVSSGSAAGQSDEPSRPVSLSPDAGLDLKDGPDPAHLTVDVEKSRQDIDDIYDATPRRPDRPEQTHGGWERPTSDSNGNDGDEIPRTSQGVELEDTADARMRTMRINSQEEKIYYDPEPDHPQMSATSYPGQEWRPFDEALDFTNGKDD